jgi:peptide chain release factor 2
MITQSDCDDLEKSLYSLLKTYDVEKIQNDIELLETELSLSGAWDNPQLAGSKNQSLSAKQELLKKIESLKSEFENLKIALELEDKEQSKKIFEEINTQKEFLENLTFLNGKFDNQGVIMSLHSGAGGVDAQDWASMLLTMYQSFFKKMGWKDSLISLSAGEEGGLKSATLEILGQNVYGFLREEAGVHRLVRISPFNSGKTRETSFALVEIIPDSVDTQIEISEIKEDEIRWDTFMSGGKGGQSVNTTYSAVRLVHIPTGITVTCQNERNQIQNRQIALKHLKNKLAVLEAKKQDELRQELRGEFHSAEWGNQIRNYVMHPYKLVKDTRSGWETNDVEKVLDGDILDIIWSVKKANKNKD